MAIAVILILFIIGLLILGIFWYLKMKEINEDWSEFNKKYEKQSIKEPWIYYKDY